MCCTLCEISWFSPANTILLETTALIQITATQNERALAERFRVRTATSFAFGLHQSEAISVPDSQKNRTVTADWVKTETWVLTFTEGLSRGSGAGNREKARVHLPIDIFSQWGPTEQTALFPHRESEKKKEKKKRVRERNEREGRGWGQKRKYIFLCFVFCFPFLNKEEVEEVIPAWWPASRVWLN